MARHRPELIERQERKTFKRMGALATQHGFKWFPGAWPWYHRTDGHAADCTDDLAHELAHYLVSPPEYRDLPHFGLGHPSIEKGIAPVEQSDELEEQASILGIVLCREVGCIYAFCKDIAEEHSWYEEGNNSEKRIAQLQEKGLWSPERQRIWNRIYKNP